jgi:hypothetical protein
MSAISTLRGTIAAALSDNTSWQVFSFPPASPLANSIVIEPGDPYIEPSNDHYKTVKPKVNFKLIVLAPMFDNQGNLINIEDYYLNFYRASRSSRNSRRITLRRGNYQHTLGLELTWLK